jgi:3-hydroxy-9,10-secoandrosta-1,3,5(10)-triene-9,17-dione monooxygenase reductase component
MSRVEITAELFRRVLGHLPTGATVITAYGSQGPTGMAVNSVTSVSLDPPLILVCPAKSSTTWPAIRASGKFCVNVLAAHHEPTCRQFAARGAGRFAGVSWHGRPAGPGLDDAVAWIECAISAEHDAGDHEIVVGAVEAMEAGEGRPALVFFRGRYSAVAADER